MAFNSITYDINLNSNLFEKVIKELLVTYPIDEIIETGTFNGLGSTTVFANTGLPVTSIESCKNNHYSAKTNLKSFNNVTLLYGSSLDINEMLAFIDKDDIYNSSVVKTKQIFVDNATNSPEDSKEFYKTEITGWGSEVPEEQNLLFDLINNDKKQLVFLDSAGGVGYMEYLKFMSIPEEFKKNKVLVLDDIKHVKHYRSVVDLKRKNHKIHLSADSRFTYCTF